MKVGALVLGIIGALVALLYGLIGYALGSLAESFEEGAGVGLMIASIALPVAAMVGAGMVMTKPIIGASLMAITAIGFVALLGFNFFTLIPILLLGVGALLGFLGSQEGTQQSTQSQQPTENA